VELPVNSSRHSVWWSEVSTLIVVWNNALLVAGLDDFAGVDYNPLIESSSDSIPLLQLPLDPLTTLSSLALGLLLVFRTNTCYSRWDKRRQAYGSIINNSRTTWVDPTKPGGAGFIEKQERLADAVCWAFSRSLMFHLLGPLEDGAKHAKDLSKLKGQEFAADLLRVRRNPTRALKEMTDALAAIPFQSILYQAEAEQSVTAFCDALGVCERIFTSPVPALCSRCTSRFLISWLFCCHWLFSRHLESLGRDSWSCHRVVFFVGD
jgi:putative membrane protein